MSAPSARYRRVGNNSAIDESLFGTNSEKDRAIRSGASATFSSSSSKQKNKKVDAMRATMESSIVITSSELENIKVNAYMLLNPNHTINY